MTVHTYLDPTASTAERVEDLLARMTLPEKVGQMLQLDARGDLEDSVVTRLAGSILHVSPERMWLAHQLVEQTRLRIPLIMADDAIHGHSFWPGATIYPTQLAMACSWDTDLVERVARATAVEVAATGFHWTFSPVLCIARDLRWGRVNETFGEDPFLLGELGSAMVRGYQGDGLADPTAILACAKHFAGYSETQGGRDASEADVSQRKLRAWFLPPFHAVAQAGAHSFMLGYQSMDGVPITINEWLLTDVLKGEWGFTGTLVTDWDNVGRMVWEQQIFPDITRAAAAAIAAGNDFVMTTPSFFEGAADAVSQGLVAEEQVDAAVRRILTLKVQLGLFENPRLPDLELQRAVIGAPAHRELALEAARSSLVLLRNDGTLPLDPATARTVAVLGPNADGAQATLGDWALGSGQVDWLGEDSARGHVETVLDGIRAMMPPGWQVTHAPGAQIGTLVPDPAGPTFPDGQPRPPVFAAAEPDEALLSAAEQRANEADVAVVVVGDCVALTGEGRSTATLDLQGGQVALLDRVAATGTPMVVVLVQSKPSTLPASALQAAAIIEAFNPGMRGGRAVAELLLGLIEPSGRLPISFARHVGQQPVYYNQLRGQHGDRYADLTQEPLFAFGDGLSYSTVTYRDLRLGADVLGLAEELLATVTLHNTGTRPAVETVQAYVSDLVTSATWAERELKAWRRVELQPGEEREVELRIAASSCSLVNAAGARVVEPGRFALGVGPSSRPATHLVQEFEIVDAAEGSL